MGMGSQRHVSAALLPVKIQYPRYTMLGGPQCRPARVWKISLPSGFDPLIVHTVASRCTDRANPAHLNTIHVSKNYS